MILPPTISLTSPTTGQTFAAPASLNLSATATDSGANITQVAFYNGSTLLGVATTSPYTLNWSNVAYGTYSITAVASNSAGVSTTSAPVTVTVNLLPVIALTSPSASQTLTAPAKLTLTATASTAGGTITQVGFFNGTTLMSALTQAPYTVTLPDLEPGTYVISAQATNSAGFSAATNPITVTVTAGGGSSGGGGTPVGGVQQVYDIQTDQLNTPRMITDANGNTVWQWDNTDPYGDNIPNQSPNGGNSFVFNLRFPGQYYDFETGTYYNAFRDYDPATGRYIESDPIGLGGGINTYSYVDANPTGWFDSLGLRPGDRCANLRCAGWNAVNDINPVSRKRTKDFPNGREYGGWLYRNPDDGTYSYGAPVPCDADGVQLRDFAPIPKGARRVGDYHTHGAYDPALNYPGNPQPGQPGYDWTNDANEAFSTPDKHSNELEDGPGYLGTPQGTTEEYVPAVGPPNSGAVHVLNKKNCMCGSKGAK